MKSKRIFASFHGGGPASLPELSLALLNSQRSAWAQLRDGYTRLEGRLERRIVEGEQAVLLQCNPQRIVSTAADINPAVVDQRAC